MELFTSLLRSFGLQKKSAPNDYPGSWVPLAGGAGGINERNLLDANKEWVFIAVDKVATSVAGIRFKAMRYARSGDDQEVFDGPLVDFLEAPGPGFTGKDFIYLNTAYKELTGNAFWEKKGKQTVQPLIPTRVQPIMASDGSLLRFKYSDGATQRDIQLKDMLHDRYIDPARPHWGAGKLQKIARWVDTSSYVAEFLSRFFVNGATFGGFVETEEESQERIKLIKLGLQNDHVGVANAHKIGVLPKGSKFSKTTANMAEMEMGATDDRYRDKILSAFGVPKTLVGLTTEVNRASAEASEYVFAKYTVKPAADDLLEFLNVSIAPMLDTTGSLYFAYDEFIPVDKDIQLREREIALNKQPYMTVNEVRATVGLPPVEGGDTIYSAPGTPLGEPVITPAAPANENDPKADPKKAIPARARKAVARDRALDRVIEKAVEVATSHHDPDAESHKGFVGRVEDHEKLVADKVRDFNNRQERDVVQRIKHITKGVKKGDVFDMDGEVSLLIDFVAPMLKGLMVEQAIAEFVDQAFPGSLDPSEPRISDTVATAAKRIAKSYNKTTAKLIASTLNEGIDSGDDIRQLTERVNRVYEFSNTVRAAAVAKTESFYIANEGSREAFRQSGVVKTMRWYTAEDEKVCEFCGPQDGKVIGVNETFYSKGDVLEGAEGGTMALDYRAINVPPLHTNCRCFIRPEAIDIS